MNNQGIDELFDELALKYYENIEKNNDENNDKTFTLNQSNFDEKKKKKCC